MELFYIVAAVAFVGIIAHAATGGKASKAHLVPSAFEHTDRTEVAEINASDSPLGWWKSVTLAKLA